jgi:hypothetical protein
MLNDNPDIEATLTKDNIDVVNIIFRQKYMQFDVKLDI